MPTQGGVYPCLRPPYVQLKHYAIDQGHTHTGYVLAMSPSSLCTTQTVCNRSGSYAHRVGFTYVSILLMYNSNSME